MTKGERGVGGLDTNENRHKIENRKSKIENLFWFSLSMAFAAMIGWMALQRAFGGEYVVQDDARQHVFWMQRFLDPALFPNDLTADYFQSVAPWGYTTVYRVMATLGIDPFVLSKLLPPVLWLIATAYCFGTCLQILPVPIASFFSSVLLNLSTVVADDINSATPRAFVYPLFLAFLYYLMKRSPVPCWIAIALQGLFYPQVMLVSCGVLVLRLVSWQDKRPRLTESRNEQLLSGVGLVVGCAALLFYAIGGATEFGPTISAAAARQMPEFWKDGRGSFFSNNPFDYWLISMRSGIVPRPSQLLKPPLVAIGLFLPLLIRSPQRYPLVQNITDKVRVLVQVLLSSIVLFFAAHAVLFSLHHPSRYTQHSFRVVMVLSAGVTLAILLDALFRWANQRNDWRRRLTALGTAIALGLFLMTYPVSVPLQKAVPVLEVLFPTRILPGYITGREPDLYQFFAQQPRDIVIASLSREANNLPSFSQRTVLVSWEYGIPYHVGYYRQVRERVLDLIRAHYGTDAKQVRQFTEKYGIDYWLIQQETFTPSFVEKLWGRQFKPETSAAIATLQQGTMPIVQQAIADCAAFKNERFVVLNAACVVRSEN
ncbi:MAG: hypothetical protein HC866_25470 [Leptolyngbyaceae cyanobacterium RU_5_1]|nr:hypothetical protein [Leptolyngbyaceae cyanobacterium RU_5_1]